MNVLPNFLIVGASKSGTSSVYHYLKQHPEIFLSEVQKEGRFFSQMPGNFNGPGDAKIDAGITRSLAAYQQLFSAYSNEKAVGDISPDYLYFHEKAIPEIKSVLGDDVKIIIILRSPIERAFSAYMHFKRDERENHSFEEALELEDERLRNNWAWAWQYKNSGLYYQQVKAYLDNFEHVKVVVFDDFRNNQAKVLREICGFLGVNDNFEFDTSYKYNVSGDPKNPLLYKLESSGRFVRLAKKFIPKKLIALAKNKFTGEKQMTKQEMNPETRKKLVVFFKDDVKKLENLIQQDLSRWLN